MASLPVDSADSLHVQIEAMKLAFADIYEYVSTRRPCASNLRCSTKYLKERAADRLWKAQDPAFGTPASGGTVYLTAADASGMMVSYIQSNYAGFGSGIVVDGTGISLQNRGYGFSLKPGHANIVAPRKRPFQTIIPGFVSKDGKPTMSFGLMGGSMQAQGHSQLMVRLPIAGKIRKPRQTRRAGVSIPVTQSASNRGLAPKPSPISSAAAMTSCKPSVSPPTLAAHN
jgi:gamma-glutamyltranspeptidase/glutathione hydrolase